MVRGFKLSRRRKKNRRAHHKFAPPLLSICPRCDQPKLPHRICGNCGFYGEEKIVDMKKL
jgi:large subunit ribosomal protein L32